MVFLATGATVIVVRVPWHKPLPVVIGGAIAASGFTTWQTTPGLLAGYRTTVHRGALRLVAADDLMAGSVARRCPACGASDLRPPGVSKHGGLRRPCR
jgi:hypothetical protein